MDMSLKVRVRVPATTANLGPGFDCLGMALSLYNELEFEISDAGRFDAGGTEGISQGDVPQRDALQTDTSQRGGAQRDASQRDGPQRDAPEPRNLVVRSFSECLRRLEVSAGWVRYRALKTDIPVARGLGSSAACIVAGVLAAREVAARLGGKEMSLSEAIDLATEIEGHPDNVVPAAIGGLTAAVWEGGPGDEDGGSLGPVPSSRVVYCRLAPPEELTMAALVPDFRLSTEEARSALPGSYGRADVVFNISRAALLVAAVATGDLGVLRTAVQDRVHQPYRLPLIPNASEVLAAARGAGSLAEFVSGSGPTIMALLRGDGTEFSREVLPRLARIPGGWKIYLLKPDHRGAVVWAE